MRGRPKAELVLTDAEHEQLTALTLRRKTAQALALRARIVLACAEGIDNKVVASRQRVTPQTVSKWRARFVEDRLDGLLDAPRPGAPRTIDDSRVDAVIAKTLESVPAGATHWSTRTMAREAGLSQTAVSRIWRAFGLQPLRQEPYIGIDLRQQGDLLRSAVSKTFAGRTTTLLWGIPRRQQTIEGDSDGNESEVAAHDAAGVDGNRHGMGHRPR